MIRIELNNYFDKPFLGYSDYETCEMIRNKYNIDNSLDIIELVIRKPIFSIHEDFFINLLKAAELRVNICSSVHTSFLTPFCRSGSRAGDSAARRSFCHIINNNVDQ